MSEEVEVWREIPGFPAYDVSNMGRVRSYLHPACGGGRGRREINRYLPPKIMAHKLNKNGYPDVGLYFPSESGKRKAKLCRVHRLVLEAFVGPCPPGMVCRHLDSNKLNCRLSNLVWGTYKENSHDLVVVMREDDNSRWPRAVLTREQVLAICDAVMRGEKQYAIARNFDVGPMAVRQIVSGATWSYVTDGHPVRSRRNPKRVLTRENVIEIKRLLSEKVPWKDIATRFDVAESTIGNIRSGHSWRSVPFPSRQTTP